MIASGIVAYTAYKAYKFSGFAKAKVFMIAFLLNTLHYVILVGYNTFFKTQLCGNLSQLSAFPILLVSFHLAVILAFILTLSLLVFRPPRLAIFAFVYPIALAGVLLSINTILALAIVVAVAMIVINSHFITNYQKKQTKQALQITIAFLCISIGWLSLFFLPHMTTAYVVAHIAELIGYLILIGTFIEHATRSKKK
ncbi:MAG: hypothetical protein ACMXYF_03760 [Candidatus Woesearchaeota archaeon]